MMTPSPSAAWGGAPLARQSWLRRAEAWLDDRGKGAWIAAMILGFVFAWPVGLALLAYMIWSKRMFSRSACQSRRAAFMERHHAMHQAFRPSGNTAFDSYKTETLKRLEDEQQAFESFLQRLRDAKDKSEFDAFMDDRSKAARAVATPAEGADRPGEY